MVKQTITMVNDVGRGNGIVSTALIFESIIYVLTSRKGT